MASMHACAEPVTNAELDQCIKQCHVIDTGMDMAFTIGRIAEVRETKYLFASDLTSFDLVAASRPQREEAR